MITIRVMIFCLSFLLDADYLDTLRVERVEALMTSIGKVLVRIMIWRS